MIMYEEIFKDFQKEKVRYVLVGGIALNLHGSLRNTADLDILIEMSNDNLAKIVTILKKHGYQVKQPVDPMGIANPKIRKEWIEQKNMKAFNFFLDKDLKEVDLIIDSPVSYEEAKKGALKVKIGGLSVSLISINDLIRMKENTGRQLDMLDVAQLKQIREMKTKK